MKRPGAVLFDLGNVLVHIHAGGFLETLGRNTPEERAMYRGPIMDLVGRYERGECSSDEYLTDLAGLFDDHPRSGVQRTNAIDRNAVQRAMMNVIGTPIKEMEDIIRRVSSVARVALLSNTNPLHLEYCRQTVPALRYLSHLYLSYELGCLKPGREIYEKVIEDMALPPEEIVFIDDTQENVDGARAAGIWAIQFQGVSTLLNQLHDLNILSSSQ